MSPGPRASTHSRTSASFSSWHDTYLGPYSLGPNSRTLPPGVFPPSPTPVPSPSFRDAARENQMQLSLDAGLRLCGGGSKVTSGTEVVSCAESRYPRGLSGGCAGWGGDFESRHYVRTALLALPAEGELGLRPGGVGLAPCPSRGQHLNLLWKGGPGNGQLSSPPRLEGEGGSGSGARVKAWGLWRGSRVRKLGQLKGWHGMRTGTGVAVIQ